MHVDLIPIFYVYMCDVCVYEHDMLNCVPPRLERKWMVKVRVEMVMRVTREKMVLSHSLKMSQKTLSK